MTCIFLVVIISKEGATVYSYCNVMITETNFFSGCFTTLTIINGYKG